MFQANYKQSKKTGTKKIARILQEGISVLIYGFSSFLTLALISHNPNDPGWSNTGEIGQVANIGGKTGAWLADILFCLFGWAAYIFPPILLYIVWIISSQRCDRQDDDRYDNLLILKISGFILLILASSSLTDLHFTTQLLPCGAGGIMGNVIKSAMVKNFNFIGTDLTLIVLWITGLTLFSEISIMNTIDLLGHNTIKLLAFTQNKIKKLTINFCSRNNSKKNEPTPYLTYTKLLDKPPTTDFSNNKPPKPSTTITHSTFKSNILAPKEKLNLLTTTDAPKSSFPLPSLTLLDSPKQEQGTNYTTKELEAMSHNVELRLRDFGIEAQVVAVHPGPVVTRFELQLAAGTKVNRITTLAKDLARSLSAISVRIVEVIPGKSVIGLELPNTHRELVRLKEILASLQYENSRAPLALALGKDISGYPVIVDLSKMPHLLVAGTTGSGKSVCLNALLLSLLYKYTPQEMRLILIDPKMLELSVYADIPHLLTPVVTDMKETINTFRWCVAEMERRYKLMATLGVRNLSSYNHKIKEAILKGSPIIWEEDNSNVTKELQQLPHIVVLADEYADMMMVVGKKIEELISRIAQKARAAGIHLILATQRPSVDVITGLIKANIPTRIAFQVSSKIDSRTIIDQGGAEQLLGFGDMLYLPPGSGIPVRIHGAFVADEEVHRVVKELKSYGKPNYLEEITDSDCSLAIPGEENLLETEDAEKDPLYDQAVSIVLNSKRASISNIQRRLKIGYNRAARIVESMEAAGLVSSMESNGNREILVPSPPSEG